MQRDQFTGVAEAAPLVSRGQAPDAVDHPRKQEKQPHSDLHNEAATRNGDGLAGCAAVLTDKQGHEDVPRG